MFRKRDTLYRRYKRTGRQDLFEQFITLRKDLDERTDSAKSSYLQARLSDALSDGNIWKKFRGLGPRRLSLTITLRGSFHKTIVRSARELSLTAVPRALLSTHRYQRCDS